MRRRRRGRTHWSFNPLQPTVNLDLATLKSLLAPIILAAFISLILRLGLKYVDIIYQL